MGFHFANTQKHILGGKRVTRKVIIKNGKGYKSTCTYRNGKKCHNKKKHLSTCYGVKGNVLLKHLKMIHGRVLNDVRHFG